MKRLPKPYRAFLQMKARHEEIMRQRAEKTETVEQVLAEIRTPRPFVVQSFEDRQRETRNIIKRLRKASR